MNSTSPHFNDVMRVRFLAYSADNRLPWQKTEADMRDEWDARSISALVSVDGGAAASIRVTVSNTGDELSYPGAVTHDDYERTFTMEPGWTKLPPRGEYVECSRTAVIPQFRGRGLWFLLGAHMIALGLATDRRFMVGSAIDELLPTWERIGYRRTGLRYFNHDIGGRIHEMIVLDLSSVRAECDPTLVPLVDEATTRLRSQDQEIMKILRQR